MSGWPLLSLQQVCWSFFTFLNLVYTYSRDANCLRMLMKIKIKKISKQAILVLIKAVHRRSIESDAKWIIWTELLSCDDCGPCYRHFSSSLHCMLLLQTQTQEEKYYWYLPSDSFFHVITDLVISRRELRC